MQRGVAVLRSDVLPDPVLRPVTVCLVSAPEPIVCSVCESVGPSSMLGGV